MCDTRRFLAIHPHAVAAIRRRSLILLTGGEKYKGSLQKGVMSFRNSTTSSPSSPFKYW
mgnify:CR=1 FL=1